MMIQRNESTATLQARLRTWTERAKRAELANNMQLRDLSENNASRLRAELIRRELQTGQLF